MKKLKQSPLTQMVVHISERDAIGATIQLYFDEGRQLEQQRVEDLGNLGPGRSDGGATTVIEYAQGIFGFDTQDFNLTMDVLLLIDGCCDGYAYRFERAS